MVTDAASPDADLLERLATGVPGLDRVLDGGLPTGGLYLVVGAPGTGKTLLANQIGFAHVAGGGRAIFVTLLAESHTRLLRNLRTLTFFDPAPLAATLHYFSGYGALAEDGLAGLLTLVRREVRDRHATLLAIDGLGAASVADDDALAYRRFLYDLAATAESLGCTILLLSSDRLDEARPEQTLADGVLELARVAAGPRTVRELEVHKLRGSGFLAGRHALTLDATGLRVHPRLESVPVDAATPASAASGRVPTGVAGLDAMLQGGWPAGSATLVLGAAGTGKTLLGLHFLAAGAQAGEAGLHVGFDEAPPQLLAKAAALGLELGVAGTADAVEFLWQPAGEWLPDALAERLLDAVARRGVRRVVLDGINGFAAITVHPERLQTFFAALMARLRAHHVTTLLAAETTRPFGLDVAAPLHGVSDLVENVALLRYVELRSRLHRLLSILKVRQSDYDHTLREFRIAADGVVVAEAFAGAEALLTGVARSRGPSFAPASDVEAGA